VEYHAIGKEMKGISQVEVLEKQRREQLQMIWQRFGKYMCGHLGTEADRVPKTVPQSSFVRFYQRLGSVGIWGFSDGSFQVRPYCCPFEIFPF
jgi:myosin-1